VIRWGDDDKESKFALAELHPVANIAGSGLTDPRRKNIPCNLPIQHCVAEAEACGRLSGGLHNLGV
jgi:hypothetical protein